MTAAIQSSSVRPEPESSRARAEGPVRPIHYETDLSQQLARVTPSLFFQGETPDELSDWQERFREKLLDSLWTLPERGPLDLQLDAEVDCGAYVRR
ncbi:MAG TPA: hypothetical protein VFN74_24460, partial [Chloroflexota bacterium]|nr:hypothetical protein [Chloroflexota bacterium]